MDSSARLVGKIARVTAVVAHDRLGEVMLAVRGGTEAFLAYPRDRASVYGVGERVVVVEYLPPRTVVVDQP